MLGASLSLFQCSGGRSGDAATVKALAVPGAVQQQQSLPSNWTMCHIMAGAQGMHKGLGGCPPQKQGQWIPGVLEQAEG